MNRLTYWLLLALCFLGRLAPGQALAAEPAPAEQPAQWKVDASAAFNSRYVWRGQVLVNDPVMQPSLNMNKGGFTFNVWGSYDLTDQNKTKGKFTEIDLSAEYAFALGRFSLPLGISNYQFPNTPYGSNTDLYAGLSYDWLVTPSLKVYQNIEQAHGQYVNLSLTYTHDLPALYKAWAWQLALAAAAGWNSHDNNRAEWGLDRDSLNDGALSLSLPVKIKGALTITPALTQVWLLDSQVREAAGYDGKTLWGLTLAASF